MSRFPGASEKGDGFGAKSNSRDLPERITEEIEESRSRFTEAETLTKKAESRAMGLALSGEPDLVPLAQPILAAKLVTQIDGLSDKWHRCSDERTLGQLTSRRSRESIFGPLLPDLIRSTARCNRMLEMSKTDLQAENARGSLKMYEPTEEAKSEANFYELRNNLENQIDKLSENSHKFLYTGGSGRLPSQGSRNSALGPFLPSLIEATGHCKRTVERSMTKLQPEADKTKKSLEEFKEISTRIKASAKKTERIEMDDWRESLLSGFASSDVPALEKAFKLHEQIKTAWSSLIRMKPEIRASRTVTWSFSQQYSTGDPLEDRELQKVSEMVNTFNQQENMKARRKARAALSDMLTKQEKRLFPNGVPTSSEEIEEAETKAQNSGPSSRSTLASFRGVISKEHTTAHPEMIRAAKVLTSNAGWQERSVFESPSSPGSIAEE